jgi:hypothetical protein
MTYSKNFFVKSQRQEQGTWCKGQMTVPRLVTTYKRKKCRVHSTQLEWEILDL